MEDEEVAESWEEAADSGVRITNLVLICRYKPYLTIYSLPICANRYDVHCGWLLLEYLNIVFRLLFNLGLELTVS